MRILIVNNSLQRVDIPPSANAHGLGWEGYPPYKNLIYMIESGMPSHYEMRKALGRARRAEKRFTGPPGYRGNIDLNKRPVVNGESTLLSMSREFDGVEVLFPTITPDGVMMSPDEATERYLNTGEHLGKFRTSKEATEMATKLSRWQSRLLKK